MKSPPHRDAPARLSSSPKVAGTTVRFRSGHTALVVGPDPATLQALWQAAHEDRPGARWALVRVSLVGRRGWPEREELVDLTAIESVILP